jgi:hypothetical protein
LCESHLNGLLIGEIHNDGCPHTPPVLDELIQSIDEQLTEPAAILCNSSESARVDGATKSYKITLRVGIGVLVSPRIKVVAHPTLPRFGLRLVSTL